MKRFRHPRRIAVRKGIVMRSIVSMGLIAATLVVASSAAAGVISTENEKSGHSGGWPVALDGTAQGPGRVDVYPDQWSIKTGETIRLKIRSTTSYAVRVFRLGYYHGFGAHQVRYQTGFDADPQPYPTTDATYGMAEARWHDSVSIGTDSTWAPGIYVARVEQPSGYQGETFFVIRDDDRTRMPILLVLPTATHQAYNAWPSAKRGGKSLYEFNSSSSIPTESRTSNGNRPQAVKVSWDRPFQVGGGTADLGTWDFPMARFLERNGWDVAYVTDEDLHARPSVVANRKAILFVGHSEYWSRGMFDHAIAERNDGVSMMFATGNTMGYQIRYEPGPAGPQSTVVGYKQSWRSDPEQELARRLENDGRYSEAAAHYAMVTRGWRALQYSPEHGIDERRPGMLLTGVQTAGAFSYWYPWADLRVRNSSHWLWSGTGLGYNATIPSVFGYEWDSTKIDDAEWDKWRPKGEIRVGSLYDRDNRARGSAGYYKHSSGAEVISWSAIAFSWALDSFASGTSRSVSSGAQRAVTNALRRWTGQTETLADTFSPAAEDSTPFVTENLLALKSGDLAGESYDLGPEKDDEPAAASSEGGCTYGSGQQRQGFVLVLAGLGALVLTRRRR